MSKGGALVSALAAVAAAWFLCAAGCAEPGQGVTSPNSKEVIASVGELASRGHDEDVRQIELATISIDSEVAAEAVRGLGSVRGPAGVEALKRVALEEQRPEVREEAVYQLGLQRESPPVGFLEQTLLRDGSPRVRAAAASSLERLRVWEDIPLLVDVAEKDPDVMVQSRAVSAVEGMIGAKIGYDSQASVQDRRKAVKRLRAIALTAGAALAPQDAHRAGGP
ncbi:MAG: HEAT repeat domain-containing protein [Planctomycetota bacterium]|nr:HEAT repeat domain-containing protein [Planctomycetota bacterium]